MFVVDGGQLVAAQGTSEPDQQHPVPGSAQVRLRRAAAVGPNPFGGAIGFENADHELIGLDLRDPGVQRAVFESPADKDSVIDLFAQHGEPYAAIPA